MFEEIHSELEQGSKASQTGEGEELQLVKMAKYYFDGQGKAIRPVIALTLGHAFNETLGVKDQEVRESGKFELVLCENWVST